jgi:hypothetical protein
MGLEAVLRHPGLVSSGEGRDDLAKLGVAHVMEARRFKLGDQGNYGNFSRAGIVWSADAS